MFICSKSKDETFDPPPPPHPPPPRMAVRDKSLVSLASIFGWPYGAVQAHMYPPENSFIHLGPLYLTLLTVISGVQYTLIVSHFCTWALFSFFSHKLQSGYFYKLSSHLHAFSRLKSSKINS
jgi:hypothetical protein